VFSNWCDPASGGGVRLDHRRPRPSSRECLADGRRRRERHVDVIVEVVVAAAIAVNRVVRDRDAGR
jgi:hypothetical protein